VKYPIGRCAERFVYN